MKCCQYCCYGRLICNKEKQEELVGCIQYQSFDEEFLLKELEINHYKSPNNDFILTAWIYARIPFGYDRKRYDTADVGVIVNGCLLFPKEAVCDKFSRK